jgi:ubiquitin-protein ligase
MDFLKEAWKPTMGLRDVLQAVRTLLATPSDTGVNSTAAGQLSKDVPAFEKMAREYVEKYAKD